MAWNGFGQHKLRNILSSLAWEEFGLSNLRYILCLRWHGSDLVNTCWGAICAVGGMGGDWVTFVSSLEWLVLVKTSWDKYCVLAGMGGALIKTIWGTFCFLVGIWGVLVYISWDAFYVLASMACVWSTCWDAFCVEITSCVLSGIVGFGQYMFWCIWWPRWRVFVNTFWNKLCALAGMGWVVSTPVDAHIEFLLP